MRQRKVWNDISVKCISFNVVLYTVKMNNKKTTTRSYSNRSQYIHEPYMYTYTYTFAACHILMKEKNNNNKINTIACFEPCSAWLGSFRFKCCFFYLCGVCFFLSFSVSLRLSLVSNCISFICFASTKNYY